MRKLLLFLLPLVLAEIVPAQVVLHATVPMRDGIALAADIYLPFPGTSAYPSILIRTPYGKSGLSGVGYVLALEGYAVIVQDTRGHGHSQGSASMFMTDAVDGYDSVEWTAAQSWSTGAVGTFGASALGIDQYMAAGEAPPHLKCMFVVVATPDLYDHAVYPGGCFRKYDIEHWAEDNGEQAGLALALLHPVRDSMWDVVDLDGKYQRVTVPTVHVGGWYDMFTAGNMRAFNMFSRLSQARGDQMLIMGPWTHGGQDTVIQGQLRYPPDSVFSWLNDLINAWFGYWLKGEGQNPAASGRVKLYTMGDVLVPSPHWNHWRTFDAFPKPAARNPWYFHPDGTLSRQMAGGTGSMAVTFDPADPLPTLGGGNLSLPAGPYDQAPLLGRPDVLAFASDFLTEPMESTGGLSARVFLSSDVPDLDISVRLADIYPDGRWMLIYDGIQKARFREGTDREVFMEPGTVYALDVDLWSTSYVFAPGHRIGCIVSGSNYPRFDVNPQTGEPVNQALHTAVGHVRIYASPEFPSQLILPGAAEGGHPRPLAGPPPPPASDAGAGAAGMFLHFGRR